MKQFLSLAALLAYGAYAQDVIAPFWEALNNLEPAGINDLYTDLNLPDTMKKFGPFPVTWESSDTLFLGHDGRIKGRFVGENKEVTLTATLYDNANSTPRAEKRDFKVSIHGFEPYSNYLFVYFPANGSILGQRFVNANSMAWQNASRQEQRRT